MSWTVGPQSVLIGTVGRLLPVKAHDDFLRAARLILERQPDARFIIVGDGPLQCDLRRLAEQLGIEAQVAFLGSRTDVYDFIAAMDVFVLPSLSEGMPMALLEAMTLGTPVVATSVGGVPEIVAHRASGLLVPARDPQALANACLALAENRLWALTMAARARRVVEEGFSRETNGRAVMNLYRAVAAAQRTRMEAPVVPSRPTVLSLSASLARGFLRSAGRHCRRAFAIAVERHRMRHLRNHPARLTGALRSAERILIVCQGNIIRSPFAARLVAQALQRQGRISVMSAGLGAVPGHPPHPTAVQIATTRSVDLSDHAASPLAAETVAASDVIFVMDIPQLLSMHERFPDARVRTFLLTCLASDAPLEIADPVDGDESRFQVCFDDISKAVRPIVNTLCSAISLR